jgi:DNA-binding MarR family transcriptional regulator
VPPEPDTGNQPALTELEHQVLGHVPQLAAYFQRARAEMPPALRDVFTTHGLTARHGAVLTQLVPDRPSGVTDLAGRLGVSLSTVSELVANLADAGLVERRDDPANRRRTLVTLAERYRPVFEEYVAVRSTPLLAALRGLSTEEQAGFLAGLTAWAREVQT